MNTEPCDRCGDPATSALLRSVQLRVDRDLVDEQTLCPDCFSDWIARYQQEMAAEMPGASEPATTGEDIRIAEEDESAHRHRFGDDSEQQVRDAVDGTGDEIRDLGTETNSDTDEDAEVDPEAGSAATDRADDDGARFD